VNTISIEFLLSSDLITPEESYDLIERFVRNPQITAAEILALDLPAKNRVEALLQPEFLPDKELRALACDFAAHTLHVFEFHAPNDHRLHKCLGMATLLNMNVEGSWERLQRVITEARPAMWRLQGTEHLGAFEACRALLLLGNEDAARMAREVAICSQVAAHRNAWENRRNDLELLVEREKEAAWQLAQIASRLEKFW
jgi:hypothetical protein